MTYIFKGKIMNDGEGWIMHQLLHSDLLYVLCNITIPGLPVFLSLLAMNTSVAWKMQTKRMTELWKCSQLKQKLTGTKSKHTTAMLKLLWSLFAASMIYSIQLHVGFSINNPEVTSNTSRWSRLRYQAKPSHYYRENHTAIHSETHVEYKGFPWCT